MSKDKKEDKNPDRLDSGRAAGATKTKFRAEDTPAKEDKSLDRLQVLQAAGATKTKKEGGKKGADKGDKKSTSD